MRPSVIAAAAAALLLCAAVFTWRSGRGSERVDLEVADQGMTPFAQNSLLQIRVPLTQLKATKVGDVVKGKVPDADGNEVAFTGKVKGKHKGSSSSSMGAITVRLCRTMPDSPLP